jgi:microcystin-dependent protein
MPYTPTTWTNEVPATTPIKYRIVGDVEGELSASATIEIVTDVTAGTPVNAANLNKLEQGLVDLQSDIDNVLSRAHPVNSIYTSTVSTDPADVFGFGTWIPFGAGRVLVGFDSEQTEFDTAEETGGAKTHTLTTPQIPSHTHTQNAHTHSQNAHNHNVGGEFLSNAGGDSGTRLVSGGTTNTSSTTATNQNTTAVNQNTGGGQAHNNLQPYIVVYFWKRTS